MSAHLPAVFVAMILILAACGSDELSRDDAVAALQTSGTTEVEATCMADTLLALGQLDAADPRLERNVERREAFLAARERCVSVEVLSATEGAASFAVEPAGTQYEEEGNYPAPSNGTDRGAGDADMELDAQRSTAEARLQRLGRSAEDATCIVDHLVALEAWYLFTDPNFGIGLDALEANAMAVCSATS